MKPLVLVLWIFLSSAAAQSLESVALSASEEKSCPLLNFHEELQDAVRDRDVGRAALLVQYPLRINDARGSFYIHDPASLGGHFGEIFTMGVRNAILAQHVNADDCGTYTLIYGAGEAIASLHERRYRIVAINLSTTDPKPKNRMGQIDFACRTETSNMLIDSLNGGKPRLRIWNIGIQLKQKPDVEIVGGKKELQGTSPCTHAVWTFRSGSTEYVLSEGRACYPDSNEPPIDALGQFSMHAGQNDQSSWCY